MGDALSTDGPGFWRWSGQMVAALALALLWLVVAGFYAKLPTAWGVAYGVGVLGMFATVQLVLPWRLDWSIATLFRPPAARALVGGAAASLVDFAAGTLWLTAFGSAGQARTGGILPAQLWVGVFLFPVIEEVAFRGWLQLTGERRLPPVAAMLVAALVFAALHSGGDWLPRLNAGLLLGAALLLTRSLWVTIGMHALSNLLVVVASQAAWLNRDMAALAAADPAWLRPSAIVANAAIMVAALAVAFLKGWRGTCRTDRAGSPEAGSATRVARPTME